MLNAITTMEHTIAVVDQDMKVMDSIVMISPNVRLVHTNVNLMQFVTIPLVGTTVHVTKDTMEIIIAQISMNVVSTNMSVTRMLIVQT
jgi:hypothetical protein